MVVNCSFVYNLTLNNFFLYSNIFFDNPLNYNFFFQDPATNMMEYMIDFHHDILYIMFLIFILILWFIIRINTLFFFKGHLGKLLENKKNIKKKKWFFISLKTLFCNKILNKQRKIIYSNENRDLEML
jgi:hypothetical protein